MSDDISTLRRILGSARTIAVVGLSAEWHRPSHFAAQVHAGQGLPHDPGEPALRIDPRRALRRARSKTSREPVDIVDVFRRTDDVLPIADSAMRSSAKCLWQQIGVKNLEADARRAPRGSTR